MSKSKKKILYNVIDRKKYYIIIYNFKIQKHFVKML